MKKVSLLYGILAFSLLFLFVIAFVNNQVYGQIEFAPVNAKWWYNDTDQFGVLEGFATYQSVEDTVINNQLCHKILLTEVGGYQSTYFVYSNDRKYYFFNSFFNDFCVFLDFNLDTGDSYIYGCDDSSSSISFVVFIDSISTININGFDLKVQYIHGGNIAQSYWGQAIEKIGNTTTFFSVLENSSAPQQLRCYQDDELGSYETGVVPTCEYTAIKLVEESTLLLMPNPALEFLLLKDLNLFNGVNIFNSLGELILNKSFHNTKGINLNISEFASGIYFLEVKRDHGSQYLFFLKN